MDLVTSHRVTSPLLTVIDNPAITFLKHSSGVKSEVENRGVLYSATYSSCLLVPKSAKVAIFSSHKRRAISNVYKLLGHAQRPRTKSFTSSKP